MSIKLILWDMDGTLANTSQGVINAVKYAASQIGAPTLCEDDYRKFIGPPNKESYNKYLGLIGEDLEKAIVYHRQYTLDKGAFESELYPGISKLLREIKGTGIKQCVMTLKLQTSAEIVSKHLCIDSIMDGVYGATDQCSNKARLIKKCLDDFGVLKEECLLIGDSIYDENAAETVGIGFVAVTYGFGYKSKSDLKNRKYDYIAETVDHLSNYLLSMVES